MQRPKVTQLAESLLNPLVGKSVAMYFHKPAAVESHAEQGRSVASI
jgi:hypothetical protein